MDGTIGKLEFLKSVDGQCLKEMKELYEIDCNSASIRGEKLSNYCQRSDEQFKSAREKYIDSLVKNIKMRFKKEDSCIFTDLSSLLEPDRVNDAEDGECESALNAIADYYGSEKEVELVEGNMEEGYDRTAKKIAPLLNGEKLKEEWPAVQGMIQGAYKQLSLEKLCKRIITLHGDLLPNFKELCKIALCMAVTSVECERTFSTQNRLKSKYRASLVTLRVDTLMKISMCGPSLSDFDPTKSVKLWIAKKKRRKGRLSQAYQPRRKSATGFSYPTHIFNQKKV